jgi:hypothetical protein
MEFNEKYAREVAQGYVGTTEPLKRLGWGVSGFVFLSPDLRTALKVHRNDEGYTTEVKVYKELGRLKISKIRGLTVPKMRDYRDDIRLIKMDVVNQPFLLDFAGVLSQPPDFSEDVMEYWHAQIRERFGSNASVVYEVYHALAQYGLYYVDFRPTNLNLTGLPGLQPDDVADDDDLLD